MRIHLELDFCPICQAEILIPYLPRLDHWQQAHADVDALTIHQVSWILDRSIGKEEFIAIYPYDYRTGGTRYWRITTIERYLGAV